MLEILDKIGSGGYGCVYRARDRLTAEIYAVKVFDSKGIYNTIKITFKIMTSLIVYYRDFHNIDTKYIVREIENLSKLQNERVVRYMKTWIDNNNSLYIQMEFCSDNLRNILDVKHLVFNRSSRDHMNHIEYFI